MLYFNTVDFRIHFNIWKADLHLPPSLFFYLKIFSADVEIVHPPLQEERFAEECRRAEFLSLPFNTAPPVAVTPTLKLFSSLLYNCNFASVVNCNINIFCTGYLICNPRKECILTGWESLVDRLQAEGVAQIRWELMVCLPASNIWIRSRSFHFRLSRSLSHVHLLFLGSS